MHLTHPLLTYGNLRGLVSKLVRDGGGPLSDFQQLEGKEDGAGVDNRLKRKRG